MLEYAHRGAEISEAIENIASNHLSKVSGNLRLAAPPSISDSLLAPIVVAFQKEYPDVHIQVFITERIVDQIAEGVDLAFRVGELEDSSLVARRILTYRHQLVASPEYLQKTQAAENAAGTACASAARLLFLAAREHLEFHSRERKRQGVDYVQAVSGDQ